MNHLKIMTACFPASLPNIHPEWKAWWSDDKPTTDHAGYGYTEQEAIFDLQRLDQERWEAEHPEEDPPWDIDAP